MKKILIILTLILTIIGTLSQVLMYTYPVYFTVPHIGLLNDYDEVELMNFDINKPIYNYYKQTEFRTQLLQVQFERKFFFSWKLIDAPLEDSYIEIPNHSIDQVKTKYKGDTIQEIIDKAKLEIESNKVSQEDEYFEVFDENNIKVKNRKIDEFKSLVIGMAVNEVISRVGYSDRAFESPDSIKNNLHDIEYLIDEEGISFVFLSFPNSPAFDTNTKLQSIGVVYNDRTIVKVPVREDGSFDFESVLFHVKQN